MQRIHLKDNVYIGCKNGFILTFQLLTVTDEKSDNHGKQYHSSVLTYLRDTHAVKGIYKHYGVTVAAGEVSQAYEQAKRETAIEIAKMPKRVIGKKDAE